MHLRRWRNDRLGLSQHVEPDLVRQASTSSSRLWHRRGLTTWCRPAAGRRGDDIDIATGVSPAPAARRRSGKRRKSAVPEVDAANSADYDSLDNCALRQARSEVGTK